MNLRVQPKGIANPFLPRAAAEAAADLARGAPDPPLAEGADAPRPEKTNLESRTQPRAGGSMTPRVMRVDWFRVRFT